MARRRGCTHGPRRKGRCPSRKQAAARRRGAKGRGRRKAGKRRCKHGVNKNTGNCLKHPRKRRR